MQLIFTIRTVLNRVVYQILVILLISGAGQLLAIDKVNNEVGYSVKDPKLKDMLNKIFSHGHHLPYFKDLGVRCIDCHNFTVKNKSRGPLADPVKMKILKPNRKICHECHLGKIAIPRKNQCSLCHADIEVLRPNNHKLNWRRRHGIKAQFDSDSCKQCHQQNECSKCHLQRDNMNPNVHRGSFKYFHSIVARSRPASCVKCHQSASFCNDCHSGKRR